MIQSNLRASSGLRSAVMGSRGMLILAAALVLAAAFGYRSGGGEDLVLRGSCAGSTAACAFDIESGGQREGEENPPLVSGQAEIAPGVWCDYVLEGAPQLELVYVMVSSMQFDSFKVEGGTRDSFGWMPPRIDFECEWFRFVEDSKSGGLAARRDDERRSLLRLSFREGEELGQFELRINGVVVEFERGGVLYCDAEGVVEVLPFRLELLGAGVGYEEWVPGSVFAGGGGVDEEARRFIASLGHLLLAIRAGQSE